MARLAKPPRNAPASPVYERFPEARSGRRRSSLPMAAINAFPLPAPMRPLPSLPEPGPIPQADPTSNSQFNKRESDADTKRSNRKATSAPSEDGSVTVTKNNVSSRPSSPKMLNGKDSASGTQDKSRPAATSGGPLVKPEQSRADRVRALRLKDLSASRMYLRGSEQAPHEHQKLELDQGLPQTNNDTDSTGQLESRADNDARYPRKNTSDPLSPPPLSPILSRQSQRPVSVKEPSSGILPTPLEEDIPLAAFPFPGGSRRSSSTRSEDLLRDAFGGPSQRCETALPSSDEDPIHPSPHKHQSQSVSSQHRRAKQTPVMGDSTLLRARHTKKADYSRPLTPRDHRSYQHEKVCPDSQSSQSSFYSQDPRGSRQWPEYALALEKRIAQLTHQNKALQAALLAALDMNNKQGLDGLLGGSETSLGTTATARSFSSATNTSSGYDEPPLPPPRHPKRGLAQQQTYRPQSWIASPDSSRPGSCESANSASVRDVEDMLEGFDFT